MESPLKREDLARPGVRLLNRGGFANPDVLLVAPRGSTPVVVKDYSLRSPLVRWLLAPLLVSHELAILHRLWGLPGVPKPRGRIDRLALAMEYIDGLPLRRRSHRGALPRAFFDGVEGILEGMALRGVAYLDIRSATNVLTTRIGDAPVLVDLGSAYRLPIPSAILRWRYRHALEKLRNRFERLEGGSAAPLNLESPSDYHELDFGAVRLRFLDEGDPDDPIPVLFLHDAGHSAEPFRTLLGAASEQGRRGIALDLPGFAGSTGRVRSFAPRAIAAHVARFIKALRLPRVDLVGVGWGGLVARSLAGDQPALVRALLTIDTPYERLDVKFRRRQEEARGDPDVLRRRLLRELPPGLPEDLRSALGIAIAETSARALTSAYRRLRVVTRKLDNGASELILSGLPRPGQPWLAVRSEGSPDREPADAPRSESWSQPLVDPARVWGALAELAATATR